MNRTQNIRRASTSRDPHYDVAPVETTRQQIGFSRCWIVFCSLGRPGQSLLTACNHALHQFGIDAERRRTLRGVEHAEAPAGSRPDVEQMPARSQRRHHGVHRPTDLGQFGVYRLRHSTIFCV